MANPTCRSCDRSADAGVYCSSCAAAIMTKVLNPFLVGKWKKLGRTDTVGVPKQMLSNARSGSLGRWFGPKRYTA